jgi:hypothetical protein
MFKQFSNGCFLASSNKDCRNETNSRTVSRCLTTSFSAFTQMFILSVSPKTQTLGEKKMSGEQILWHKLVLVTALYLWLRSLFFRHPRHETRPCDKYRRRIARCQKYEGFLSMLRRFDFHLTPPQNTPLEKNLV